jgi:dolichol-phosphate mannosyltransferase
MSIDKISAISIVIPVLDEELNIEPLYQEIKTALAKADYTYEVVFVDDGSHDQTVKVLKKLAAENETLKLVAHKKNYGQSAAFVTGVRHAKHPWIVTLDGDGQNDARDIPLLVSKYTEPKSVVLGNRKKRNDSFIKRLSSRVGNHIRKSLLKDDCLDTGCSLKLFPRDAFLQLPHFNHLHRYLPALFKRAGFQIINVPVNHRPRLKGQSKYGMMNRLFVGIHDLIGVKWLMKRPCQPEVNNEQA